MKHSITVEIQAFVESLKSAQNYVKKDGDDALSHILLSHLPRQKKLAVIACDGRGYFERRLAVIVEHTSKPSLPGKEQSICISAKDAQALLKIVPPRTGGYITLGINDDDTPVARVILSNGSTAVFNARTDLNLPNYAEIRAKAEKGKKNPPNLTNVHLPVHEMLRAGKSLPAKSGAIAKMFTANGTMALLEYLDDLIDIRIIFTFANPATA